MKIRFVDDIFSDTAEPQSGDAKWATEWHEDGSPGQISGIIFCCPCGCGEVSSVPVIGDRKWNWDGNKETPTLTPSILKMSGCRWHGFLTAGEWRTC